MIAQQSSSKRAKGECSKIALTLIRHFSKHYIKPSAQNKTAEPKSESLLNPRTLLSTQITLMDASRYGWSETRPDLHKRAIVEPTFLL